MTFQPSESAYSESSSRSLSTAAMQRAAVLSREDFQSLDTFTTAVSGLIQNHRLRGVGKLLFEVTKRDPKLQKLITGYQRELKRLLLEPDSDGERERRRLAFLALESLGIGEVVFVTPEAHHAEAGGLARVITGLSRAFSDAGIAVSIITPLYEQDQGSRHGSAEQMLRDGLDVDGEKLPVVSVGKIKIGFGPTYESWTTTVKSPAEVCPVEVLMAEKDMMRVYFLRHSELAASLYSHQSAEQALREAVFLSRGSLELLSNPDFGIDPHIIITNDWLAGLIPAYLELDPRYKSSAILRRVKTMHVVHNCGKPYQGRQPVNEDNTDLWPLLGLAGEHFWGLTDPHDKNFLNLTAAAVFHVKNAIVAVSRPYAAQLLGFEGGDGLEAHFQRKESVLYGISNGVNLEDLRETFWRLGERALEAKGKQPLMAERFTEASFLRYLPVYKEISKELLQESLGLEVNKNAIICSFVGRITEQKGIRLLTEIGPGKFRTLLDELLERHANLQFVIAGPVSPGDESAAALVRTCQQLQIKYPGRVQAIFDFVAHEVALKITEASDVLLMPSRYEPGGISQLEALASGTIVVARNVGGISATLVNFHPKKAEGNAFLFQDYSAAGLSEALNRAVAVLDDKRIRRKLFRRAVLAANDWSDRIPKYLALFQHISGVLRYNDRYRYLRPHCAVVETLRPE